MLSIEMIIERLESGKEVKKQCLIDALKSYDHLSKHHAAVENELVRLKEKK